MGPTRVTIDTNHNDTTEDTSIDVDTYRYEGGTRFGRYIYIH